MIRAISFRQQWRGKLGRNDARDIDMTFGQRELLVRRGIAEWVDDVPPRQERKPKQRESAANVE